MKSRFLRTAVHLVAVLVVYSVALMGMLELFMRAVEIEAKERQEQSAEAVKMAAALGIAPPVDKSVENPANPRF